MDEYEEENTRTKYIKNELHVKLRYFEIIISIIAPILARYVISSAFIITEMGILLFILGLMGTTILSIISMFMLIDVSDIIYPTKGIHSFFF